MKSAPTSGPFTVSSQVTQAPQGIRPPEQFIMVPFRLVKDPSTRPSGVVCTVVVPPPAIGVVRRARTERGLRVVDLVVAHQHHRAARAGEGAHAVVPAGEVGAVVEDDGLLGVVERAVGEATGQVQPHLAVTHVGHREELVAPGWLAGVGGCGHQTGEGAGRGRGGAELEDGTAIDGHAQPFRAGV